MGEINDNFIASVAIEKLKENPFAKELFADLKGEDYEMLKRDIQKNGIRLPLEILEDFTVIDGHQRLKIARELAMNYVPCLIKKLSDFDAKVWVITANLARRQLKPEERAIPIAKLSELYENPTGADHKSIDYQDAKSASGFDNVLEKTSEITGFSERTIADYRAYAKAIAEHPELKDKPISWALKEANRRKNRIQRLQQAKDMAFFSNLILGDALDNVQKLSSESIDCVIIDPPYGIEWEGTTKSDDRIGWQPILNDNIEIFDYLSKLAPELLRVMKKDADLYCFCGRFDSYCNMLKIFSQAGFAISNVIIWKKNMRTSGPDFYCRYAHLHEFIIYAKKGKRFLNNSFSPDVLEFDKVMNGFGALQKPIPLLSYFIANSTVEGETVLDCFAGTGSTLVAAEQLKRKWIGIEIDSQWYEIAKSRLIGGENK